MNDVTYSKSYVTLLIDKTLTFVSVKLIIQYKLSVKKMNKIILMFAIVIVLIYDGTAQSSNADMRTQFSFGAKLGANYSNVYDSQGEAFNADGKLGAVGGIFLTVPISKYIGVQPEVLLSQKGFKATGNVLNNSYNLTRTTTYVDVPLLLLVKPVPFLSLVAGPQFSYLLKQKNKFTGAGATIDQEREFENDNIRKNTLGFIGGADINLGKIVVGARVAWDLQENNGDGTSTTPRYKNTWVQGTLGYKF